MSAPKVLFVLAGIAATITLTTWLLGIWTGDARWVETCHAVAAIGGISAFAGTLTAIVEEAA